MKASLDPADLKNLIEGSHTIYSAMKGKKIALKEEKKTIAFAFASVASTRKILKVKNSILITFFQLDQEQVFIK